MKTHSGVFANIDDMYLRNVFYLQLFLAGCLLFSTAGAATPALHPFSATYQVKRNGSVIGQSTLTLSRTANGNWRYVSHVHGTHGLAALLGASISEISTFRWHDDHLEALSYDYKLNATFKSAHSDLAVDWSSQRASMTEHGKMETYATAPGLVERHIVPLALALAVCNGKTLIPLPVAVKDRVQIQRFKVIGSNQVSVPAGHFDARKVERVDKNNGFTVWYSAQYPLAPIKLAQSSGGHIDMLLESYTAK